MYEINIFLSYAWEKTQHNNTIKNWIFKTEWNVEGNPVSFKDLSLAKHPTEDKALQQAINEQIDKSHVVLIPIGTYARYSRWIEKEIEACKRKRPILAVNPWERRQNSLYIEDHATDKAHWDQALIVQKIWDLYAKYHYQKNKVPYHGWR